MLRDDGEDAAVVEEAQEEVDVLMAQVTQLPRGQRMCGTGPGIVPRGLTLSYHGLVLSLCDLLGSSIVPHGLTLSPQPFVVLRDPALSPLPHTVLYGSTLSMTQHCHPRPNVVSMTQCHLHNPTLSPCPHNPMTKCGSHDPTLSP